MEQIIRQIYAQARQIGCCSLFTGKEKTLDDIIALFTSPQGMEFCIQNHFPNMATFRLFKPYNVEQKGIYIDSGTITLKNPENAVLIGRTSATIYCDSNKAKHNITLLHGAKAIVTASQWAVVATQVEPGCNIIKNTNGNAIIL